MGLQKAYLSLIESKLWVLCIVCEISLCLALLKRGMVGRYPWLFGLALVNAMRDLTLASMSGIGITSMVYKRLWILTLPILMCVQIATVAETYTKLTARYPGIEVFASFLLRGSMSLLVVGSCISAAWNVPFQQTVFQAILFAYRYLALVLAGCLALPFLFLSKLPRPGKRPARNIKLHLCGVVGYFGIYCISALLVNVLGLQFTAGTLINIIMMLVLCSIYCFWTVLLTQEGEIAVEWPEPDASLIALIDRHSASAIKRGEKLEERTRESI